MKQSDLFVGCKVRYQPVYYKDRYDRGIVKEIPRHTTEEVRVVYNCNGEWTRYLEYTGALTRVKDLKLGWLKGD